jgi:hypothetical protein
MISLQCLACGGEIGACDCRAELERGDNVLTDMLKDVRNIVTENQLVALVVETRDELKNVQKEITTGHHQADRWRTLRTEEQIAAEWLALLEYTAEMRGVTLP